MVMVQSYKVDSLLEGIPTRVERDDYSEEYLRAVRANLPVARHKDRSRRAAKRSISNDAAGGADYTVDEIEFMMALDRYKRNHNPYPTWAEVLRVAKSLGWSK